MSLTTKPAKTAAEQPKTVATRPKTIAKPAATPDDRTDVVIVGAGPAGLFAALALHSAGLGAVIAAGPRRAGLDQRTSALLDGSVKALATLGVWPDIADQAAPLRVMRLVDDTGRLIRAPLFEGRSDEIGLDAFGYNIANADLNAGLRAAVDRAGIPVVDEAVTSVAIGSEGVAATLVSGRILSARLVAGADGRESIVRRTAGIETVETRYPQTAVTANFGHSRPHDDISTEFHTRTGPFTLVPLPGQRSSLVCVVTPDDAARMLALDDAAFSREIERRSQAILGKVTVEPGRGRFDLSVVTPKRFGVFRAALIGEAAHVVPPIGAQGLNLGLRDGAALADCLADVLASGADIGGEAAMDAYDRARRADIVSRSLAIHALNRSLLSDFMPVHGLRGLGLWLMDQVGPLRRAFMREGLQPGHAQPRLMRGEMPDHAA
ncbi:UbiH/UbiF family hydroxylase [Phreatobacter stygius]|uniref:UbiH/UbiF family hydroxylase n=1 Tax=Phreatobacter stygius TaxID=1940610 RepID=A0A4D7BEN6_9HYPH|nr:UbiH/UbiF family hydroxylase [Phreatobacter stygius]QCI68388.1 UbiH/UbiF family hydroxylase [Phreatobacter stygius]